MRLSVKNGQDKQNRRQRHQLFQFKVKLNENDSLGKAGQGWVKVDINKNKVLI